MRLVRVPALLVAAAVVVVTACSGSSAAEPFVELIDPQQASEVLNGADSGIVLLDIRTPEEFGQARIAGAINIDYYAADFRQRLSELDRDATYVVYCRTGNRSETGVRIMQELGFDWIYEMDGGIVRWYEAGFPIE